MARRTLIGTRIREQRLAAGMRQAELARRVDISASYLNLIEHNRRRIAGRLLNDLARVLDVEPDALARGVEAALVDGVREATAWEGAQSVDLNELEEFAGRYPNWASLLVATHKRAQTAMERVDSLTDRLANDPALSEAMHEMLSTVTAIRSAADILVETKDLAPDWQQRFQRNLAEDSARLTESSAALVQYLDAKSIGKSATQPSEEVDAVLAAQSYSFPDLERVLSPEPDVLVRRLAPEISEHAAEMLTHYLHQYKRDARVLPRDTFEGAVQEIGPDPAGLAQRFGVDLMAVFRRLASLPPDKVEGPIGFVTCDNSGALTFRKPIEGFSMPRFGAACALWPLFQALVRPMMPIRHSVEMGVRNPRRFQTFAYCAPSEPTAFDAPIAYRAAMLIMPVPPETEPRDAMLRVGVTCRICSQTECSARREPSILGEML